MQPTPRQAARLLVLDSERGAVLLVQYEDSGRQWWATPGGGLQGTETFEQAAMREAAEELAVSAASVSPLWERTTEFSIRGRAYRQEERYFLLHIPSNEVALGPEVRAAHREEGIIAARWWSLEELQTTLEQIFPEDLPQRMRELRLLLPSTD